MDLPQQQHPLVVAFSDLPQLLRLRVACSGLLQPLHLVEAYSDQPLPLSPLLPAVVFLVLPQLLPPLGAYLELLPPPLQVVSLGLPLQLPRQVDCSVQLPRQLP